MSPPSQPIASLAATDRHGSGGSTEPQAAGVRGLSERLTGRLPCVNCRYDLQSLSILDRCPECGTPVQVTILAVVDPMADELQAIRRPQLVAVGLVVWPLAALLAVSLTWAVGIGQALATYRPLTGWPMAPGQLAGWVAGLVCVSGLAATVLIAPHKGLPRKTRLLTALAVSAHAPLAWLTFRLDALSAMGSRNGEPAWWTPWPARTAVRAAALGLIVFILLGLRPHARVLVHRCLAMRAGRVDRQTMLAMVAAVCLLMAGDGIGAIAYGGRPHLEILATAAVVLSLVGAILLTIGLAGSLVDGVRIASAVLRPARGTRHLFSPDADGSMPAEREQT